MKVLFMKKCYNSVSHQTYYDDGTVYDLTDKEAELMRGRDNDHFVELPAEKPEEPPAPKRGRPAKTE